jgi:DNA replication protein DnaC
MNSPIPSSTRAVLAEALERITKLLEDDAFWQKREAELAERERVEREEREAAEDALRARRFSEIPGEYQRTFDPAQSTLAKETILYCRDWTPNAGTGIGLMGATGMGKTRLLCATLRKQPCSWLYLPASKLSLAVSDQWNDAWGIAARAGATLREARRVRVLLLDDIGDEKHTEAVTAELKDLVEHRTSRSLPILWTSNLSPEQITAKHGERGAAIVRRLAEFSWSPGEGGNSKTVKQ